MSKINRKKHLNVIELLIQAIKRVGLLLEQGKVELALALLVESQETAVALGTHVEKLYGIQTKTVQMLEAFCEALYQLSVALSEGGDVIVAYGNLQSSVAAVKATYEEEFPDKLEVVFLPYKAAMWDSLESVWKAAAEDADCDAYVVPIPYYELDEERNFIEYFYEGDKYPEYVPITSYKEYDLELHHPDVIFIHNPYDSQNNVTSVAKEFYSSRLKDYTEKLVYIPYFVLGKLSPDNPTQVESVREYCITYGVLNADQVIVESENMRQIYIKNLLDYYGDTPENRKMLEKKVLGLGSPKFDKVTSVAKEDVEVPGDWKTVITKADGEWKKVIFYNTSVASFLKDCEKMLLKIKDVLRIFEENQEDVALLWRPHPLMEQTVKRARPDLIDEYMTIVEEYKNAGWGIYDDTPDMDRAIALSDAYYGDASSVVELFREVGKPVMLQELSEKAGFKEECYVDNWIEYESKLIFTPHNLNVLVEYNTETSQSDCIIPLHAESRTKQGLYADVLNCGDKIVLIPQRAKEFVIIDKNTKKCEYIRIPVVDEIDYCGELFSKGYIYNNHIYAIGKRYPGFVKINLEQMSVEIIDEWYKEITEIGVERESYSILSYNSIIVEEKLYIIVNQSDLLLEYDFTDETHKLYHLNNTTDKKYAVLGYYKNNFWFTRDGMHFFKWNNEKLSGEEIIIENKNLTGEEIRYALGVMYNEKMYLFSTIGCPILIVDLEKEVSEIIDFASGRDTFRSYKVRKKDNCAYITEYLTNKVYQLSFADNVIQPYSIKLQSHHIYKEYADVLNTEMEGDIINLQEFMKIIKHTVVSKKAWMKQSALIWEKVII